MSPKDISVIFVCAIINYMKFPCDIGLDVWSNVSLWRYTSIYWH